MPVKHLKDYRDNALTAFRLRTIHIICIQDENTDNIQSPISETPFLQIYLADHQNLATSDFSVTLHSLPLHHFTNPHTRMATGYAS